jgi:hypothetical protein
MTERVNDMVTESEEARRLQLDAHRLQAQPAAGNQDADKDTVMRDDDDSSDATETDSELADSTDSDNDSAGQAGRKPTGGASITNSNVLAAAVQATYFVVDSFNIHRLIIAGVTCASKFFSDVFYTNSRYAKVCTLDDPEPYRHSAMLT